MVITVVLVFFLAIIAFSLSKFSKRFSWKPSFELENLSKWEDFSEQDRKNFFRLHIMSIGFCFLFVAVLAVGWQYIFSWVVSTYQSFLGTSVYFIEPDPAIWWGLAFFISILTCHIPIYIIFNLILDSEGFEKLKLYELLRPKDRDHGGYKVHSIMVSIGIPFIFAFFFLFANQYVKVTSTEFIVNKLSNFNEVRYLLSNIKKIEWVESFKAPNGNVVTDRPYFQITFENGYVWSFRDMNLNNEEETIKFIRKRTGKEITNINLL
jgi:hypothetical protein